MPQRSLWLLIERRTSVSYREKDMDHAVRIPEMGVSKVSISGCVISAVYALRGTLRLLTTMCLCSSSMQKSTLTRSSRATCWWTKEARTERSSMATGSYRSPPFPPEVAD